MRLGSPGALGRPWARATLAKARGRRRERGPELRGPGLHADRPRAAAGFPGGTGRRARGARRDSAYLRRRGWACRPRALQRAGAWPCHCPPPPEPPAARAGPGRAQTHFLNPAAASGRGGRAARRARRARMGCSWCSRNPPEESRLSFPARKPQAIQFTAHAQEMTGPTGPSSVTSPPGLGTLLPPRMTHAAITWVGSGLNPVYTVPLPCPAAKSADSRLACVWLAIYFVGKY